MNKYTFSDIYWSIREIEWLKYVPPFLVDTVKYNYGNWRIVYKDNADFIGPKGKFLTNRNNETNQLGTFSIGKFLYEEFLHSPNKSDNISAGFQYFADTDTVKLISLENYYGVQYPINENRVGNSTPHLAPDRAAIQYII